VFGGSFDPPHVGHVLVPAWLRAVHGVDEVWVVPAAAHAFAKDSSPYDTRVAWTRAAFREAGPGVLVSTLEATLRAHRPDAPVYALDLLDAVAARCPDDEIRLVVGSDIVTSGETARWHRWPEIERRYAPIVVPRAGHDDRCVAGLPALPEVSSTAIRAALAAWDATQGGPSAPARAEAEAAIRHTVPRAVARMLLEPARARVAIVGLGHAGRSLAAWLRTRHVEIIEVQARGLDDASVRELGRRLAEEGPRLRGVWLTVRDSDLARVAARLIGHLTSELPVLHASGARVARGAGALASLAAAGHPVGTLHPICALRRELEDRSTSDLDRASFGVEGDASAVELAAALVEGAALVRLDDLDAPARVTYHAACALAANHLAVPRQAALSALASIGLDQAPVASAIDALMASSLAAIRGLGVPRGISGPAARGDLDALAAHAAALPEDARAIYEVLSARLVALLRSPTA
jgi:nicotinate (nicotinamide) nucleotide adenylyltransferase